MWVPLLLIVLLLVGLALMASIANSAATYNAAQAAVEAARATQIAAAGQTAASLTATILAVLLVLVIILAGVVIAWLLWRDRRRAQIIQQAEQTPRASPGRWVPGPNARFQLQGQASPQVPAGADLSQVITALLLARLLDAPAREALPRPSVDTETHDPWRW